MKWFYELMRGRYGIDSLSWALLFVYLFLVWMSRWFHVEWIGTASLVVLFYVYFRMLSRNTSKRYAENQVYLRFYNPIKHRVQRWFHQIKQMRDFRYLTCQGCKQKLRVPRNKKNITVTCPKCHTKFDA